MSDCKEVFEWRNNELTRQMAGSSEIVIWDDHLRWYENALANENRMLLICEAKDRINLCKLGIVRFDFNEDSANSEISINLSPSIRGKGYAKKCLKKSIAYMLDERPMCDSITANIKKINKISKYLFEQVGFKMVSENDIFWKLSFSCQESR